MKNFYFSVFISFLLCSPTFFLTGNAQGLTTGNFSGIVLNEQGEAVEGATVIAVHVPSGTRYGAITRTGGNYVIANARVGGPYELTTNFVGSDPIKRSDIYLTLGQTLRVDFQLAEDYSLDEVEITSSAIDVFDGNRTGLETVINERTINSLPTVTRSIADFVRVNPLVDINEGTDGFSFSIGGQNNRFNAIYIDGSINNDAFGLAGSGTDGGQTGAGPISLDAIEQFQVSVAPFDVRLSGFAGGAVNIVTRSGSNDIDASAYYLLRNENLAGRFPGANTDGSRLNDFSAETYGFRVGGTYC